MRNISPNVVASLSVVSNWSYLTNLFIEVLLQYLTSSTSSMTIYNRIVSCFGAGDLNERERPIYFLLGNCITTQIACNDMHFC